jgi:hypothetical protein
MSDSEDKIPGLGELFGKVQQFQQRLEETQQRLGGHTVEAESGGGMVKVVANGRREVVSIHVEREVIDPEEPGMLQDLIVAAVNSALDKAERAAKELVEEELGQLTGGMLPNLFGKS